MPIDFNKVGERRDAVINLKKAAGIETQKAQVVLLLDYSISMNGLYMRGVVQDVVERILPLGLAFDDNKEVDFILFHDSYIPMPEPITLKNLDGYIPNKVIGHYSMGGTNYAPALNAVLNNFAKKKSGLFSSGYEKMDLPVYVIFITDGENGDHRDTEAVVKKMASTGIFIQFVGIGREQFSFLRKLDDLKGRELDNANFAEVNDIAGISDVDLYAKLMAEFPGWVVAAKNKGFIA